MFKHMTAPCFIWDNLADPTSGGHLDNMPAYAGSHSAVDKAGRCIKAFFCIPTERGFKEKTLSYEYDKQGNLMSVIKNAHTHGEETVGTYTYCTGGNRLSAWHQDRDIMHYHYDTQVRCVQAGNVTYTYDDYGRCTHRKTKDPASQEDSSIQYFYDSRSRIIRCIHQHGMDVSLKYTPRGVNLVHSGTDNIICAYIFDGDKLLEFYNAVTGEYFVFQYAGDSLPHKVKVSGGILPQRLNAAVAEVQLLYDHEGSLVMGYALQGEAMRLAVLGREHDAHGKLVDGLRSIFVPLGPYGGIIYPFTGLILLGNAYYDPHSGLVLSPAPERRHKSLTVDQWNESDHPRDRFGKFSNGSGGEEPIAYGHHAQSTAGARRTSTSAATGSLSATKSTETNGTKAGAGTTSTTASKAASLPFTLPADIQEEIDDLLNERERDPQPRHEKLQNTLAAVARSTLKLLTNIAVAISRPGGTATSLANIIQGVVCKTLGFENSSVKYADAIVAMLEEKYGSLEAFKSALEKDPVDILADVSLLFTLGGASLMTAAKAGALTTKLAAGGSTAGVLAQKATPVLGGLGKKALRAGAAVDPLTPLAWGSEKYIIPQLKDTWKNAKEMYPATAQALKRETASLKNSIEEAVHEAAKRVDKEMQMMHSEALNGRYNNIKKHVSVLQKSLNKMAKKAATEHKQDMLGVSGTTQSIVNKKNDIENEKKQRQPVAFE